MERNIRDAVGDAKQGAVNRNDDVRTVQGLLNIQMVKDHRSDRFVQVNGSLESETLNALLAFQRRHGYASTGLIEPGDATIRALASFNERNNMHASKNLFDFLKAPGMEGNSRVLYDSDGADNTTIGVGHLVHEGKIDHNNPAEAKFVNGISDSEVEQLFWEDVRDPEREVNAQVRVPLTQNQFDALVSLAFNLRRSTFEHSTLLKLINQGDYAGAANQLDRFKYAHDHLRHGPVAPSGFGPRRKQEAALFRKR